MIQRAESPSSRAVAVVECTTNPDSPCHSIVSIESGWFWSWESETVMRATNCRGLSVRWISDSILEIQLMEGTVLDFSETAYIGFRQPFQRVEIRLIVSPEKPNDPKLSQTSVKMSR